MLSFYLLPPLKFEENIKDEINWHKIGFLGKASQEKWERWLTYTNRNRCGNDHTYTVHRILKI